MHEKVKIRQATELDAPVLIEFNVRMAMEAEERVLNLDILTFGVKSILQRPALGFYLAAEVEGKVVGALMVTTEWSDWRNGAFWWIQSVYVIPERRRGGVFRALYEDVKRRAKRSTQVCGFRSYVERDNLTAQATYRGLGMKETKYKIFEEPF